MVKCKFATLLESSTRPSEKATAKYAAIYEDIS